MHTAESLLSCADFTFPLLGHAHALRLIAAMGFAGVDVGLFTGRSHVQPEYIEANAAGHGEALKRQVADCGLRLTDVFVQLGEDPSQNAVSEADAETRRVDRDRFRRCVEFAQAAGAVHLTGLPGVPVEGGLGRAVDETTWRLDTVREAGLQYAIEPHVGSNCPTIAATQAFVDRVPGLTLTLDYGHFVYQGQPADSAAALLPHASHFHARGGAPGRLQAALPANVIDFAPMVDQVLRLGQSICVEYVWVDWEHCNEVDNVSETVRLREHLCSLAVKEQR